MRSFLFLFLTASLMIATIRIQPQPHSGIEQPEMKSNSAYLQGWAPGHLGLTISPDGKTAYVPFELDDSLLVVDLPSLTVSGSIDLSAAGTMLGSCSAVLAPVGQKLFIANYTAQNVAV